MSENGNMFYHFGEFRFDAEKRVLWKRDEALSLPPKATDVLSVLIKDHGHLVERQQLLESVWRDTFVEEGNLNNAISALRRILGERDIIQTIPRRGYRFRADIVELSSSPRHHDTGSDTLLNGHTTDAPDLVIERHIVSHSVISTEGDDNPGNEGGIRVGTIPLLLERTSLRWRRLVACAALPLLFFGAWFYPRTNENVLSASGVTFQNSGIVLTDFGFSEERAQAIALQPDGKIVAAGWAGESLASSDIAVARYNPDGSLDPTFDSDGKIVTRLGEYTDTIYGLAVQPDGKIIAVGVNYTSAQGRRFAILRYKPDGALDASFDGDGIVLLYVGNSEQDTANTVLIGDDGSIVVAGSALNSIEARNARILQNDFAVVRLKPDGSLDAGFGNGGIVITDFGRGSDVAYAIAEQPNGAIIVAGMTAGDKMQDWGIVRYRQDGTLDDSFGSAGKVRTNFLGEDNIPWSLALQPDGKLIAAGYALKNREPRFAVSRYAPDGSLDNSFGEGGKLTFDINGTGVGREVFALPDGRILVAGRSGIKGETEFGAAVISPAGKLLESSARRMMVDREKSGSIEVHGAVILPNGDIVLAGGRIDGKTSDFALARIEQPKTKSD